MNPGDLNTRIRIQEKTVIKDSEGCSTEQWKDLGVIETDEEKYIWARWQWLHGSEFWQAQTVQSTAVASVTIRYKRGLTPDMRVLFNGSTYNIVPPIDNILEKNRYIEFKVETFRNG